MSKLGSNEGPVLHILKNLDNSQNHQDSRVAIRVSGDQVFEVLLDTRGVGFSLQTGGSTPQSFYSITAEGFRDSL